MRGFFRKRNKSNLRRRGPRQCNSTSRDLVSSDHRQPGPTSGLKSLVNEPELFTIPFEPVTVSTHRMTARLLELLRKAEVAWWKTLAPVRRCSTGRQAGLCSCSSQQRCENSKCTIQSCFSEQQPERRGQTAPRPLNSHQEKHPVGPSP